MTTSSSPSKNLEKQEVKNSRLPECWHKFDDNNHYLEPDYVRELLQILGTDCGRNIIHPNCWVNALFSNYPSDKIINDMKNNNFHHNMSYFNKRIDHVAKITVNHQYT